MGKCQAEKIPTLPFGNDQRGISIIDTERREEEI